MPELPEVEVLVRHLGPLLKNKTIRQVHINRERVLAGTSPQKLRKALRGATFESLTRRGKYLLFQLRPANRLGSLPLLGHLGMTGRMYLLPSNAPLPKHAAVVLDLGRDKFVFEDTRYFGKLTLDTAPLDELGPEPLASEFEPESFAAALKRSSQPIKVKLLDQCLVAGVGNIYASEALFRALISPFLAANTLRPLQIRRLHEAIRQVLLEAIERGSTVPLNFSGDGARDGLFYYGRAPETPAFYEERLRVYDREGKPCFTCGTHIVRSVQAARSTFYCPHCQRTRNSSTRNSSRKHGSVRIASRA
jgi:formamidopyrimidine-DNA glycosylase